MLQVTLILVRLQIADIITGVYVDVIWSAYCDSVIILVSMILLLCCVMESANFQNQPCHRHLIAIVALTTFPPVAAGTVLAISIVLAIEGIRHSSLSMFSFRLGSNGDYNSEIQQEQLVSVKIQHYLPMTFMNHNIQK